MIFNGDAGPRTNLVYNIEGMQGAIRSEHHFFCACLLISHSLCSSRDLKYIRGIPGKHNGWYRPDSANDTEDNTLYSPTSELLFDLSSTSSFKLYPFQNLTPCSADPWERSNLAQSPVYARAMKGMRAWMKTLRNTSAPSILGWPQDAGDPARFTPASYQSGWC